MTTRQACKRWPSMIEWKSEQTMRDSSQRKGRENREWEASKEEGCGGRWREKDCSFINSRRVDLTSECIHSCVMFTSV